MGRGRRFSGPRGGGVTPKGFAYEPRKKKGKNTGLQFAWTAKLIKRKNPLFAFSVLGKKWRTSDPPRPKRKNKEVQRDCLRGGKNLASLLKGEEEGDDSPTGKNFEPWSGKARREEKKKIDHLIREKREDPSPTKLTDKTKASLVKGKKGKDLGMLSDNGGGSSEPCTRQTEKEKGKILWAGGKTEAKCEQHGEKKGVSKDW